MWKRPELKRPRLSGFPFPSRLSSEPQTIVGPVLGYRDWMVTVHKDTAYLHSRCGFRWEGPVVRGGFDGLFYDGERYPVQECRAKVAGQPGAMFFDEDYLGYHFWKGLQHRLTLVAVGVCSLFGRVIQHQLGYRAECARVEAITYRGDAGYYAESEERYTCTSLVDLHGEPLLIDEYERALRRAEATRQALAERYQCEVYSNRGVMLNALGLHAGPSQ